ncbi:MAG: AmmeMemoRadiSam system protein B [Candidatus Promineifilaceae bacterium]|nr:AmmeMemoRadiSam system protein B [Candidatus Promineifilaceae bacterium]
MWFLRDPLRLSEFQLFIPQTLTPLLLLIDGSRTPRAIHDDFCQYVGESVPFKIITDALEKLDKACLLDNPRALAAKEAQLANYRAEAYRTPSLAGHGYPAQPHELDSLLDSFDTGDNHEQWPSWKGRGIVSPHIDYHRGGPVYSQVWNRAVPAIEASDLVIIFGTDHSGGPGTITLTRQPYATPYGVLPIELDVVDKLAGALGEHNAFSDELHHRDEHSIELSAVWLHHIIRRHDLPDKAMLPILVGSFQHFIENGDHPRDDQRLNSFLKVLQEETKDRKVLAVASVDLAHIGPAFGDPFYADAGFRSQINTYDQALIYSAIGGDSETWYEQIAANQDRYRICGFSPTYILLRFLGPTRGRQIAYDQCPADADNNSLVSICGLLIE